MKYFIDPATAEIYAYENNVGADSISSKLDPITEEEAKAIVDNISNPTGVSYFKSAIQKHLDQKAIDFGYEDIKSAVTYADEPSVKKFQDEGRALRAWRSLIWDYSNKQFSLFEAGEREITDVKSFIDELPEIKLT